MPTKTFSNLLALTIVCLVMAGCEKSDETTHYKNIVGCWTKPMYVDNSEGKSIYCFEKAKSLPNNSGGTKFYNDGTLIERKNSGDCGTPPIAYANFSGNWQVQENGDIIIDVAYWGGMEHKVWKVIDITNKTLTIEIVLHENNLTID